MNLNKNPFFVLNVSCTDNRRKIAAQADDAFFSYAADICLESQSALLNPSKRLQAEIDWFCEETNETIEKICISIKSKKPIITDHLHPLSKLNAMIYNISLLNFDDIFELGYSILAIDEQYDSLNIESIVASINFCREKAGMTTTILSEVSSIVNEKRDTIGRIIAEKLERFNNNEYLKLTMMITKNCIRNGNYEDGIIISDFIEKYELNFSSFIDKEVEKLFDEIEKSTKLLPTAKKAVVKTQITKIIKSFSTLLTYVLPIKIQKEHTGIEYHLFNDILFKLRELAVSLNNDLHRPDLSISICNAIKGIIENSNIPFDIDDDLQKLKDLQAQIEKEEELKKESLLRNRYDNDYSVIVHGTKYSVPPFCTCCMKPTDSTERLSYSETETERTFMGKKNTTRTISCDMPVCNECLEHRKKFKGASKLLCSVSIAFGAIIMFSLTYSKLCNGFPSFVIGGVSSLALFYILSFIFKVSELPAQHSTRTSSVSISTSFVNGSAYQIVFNFKNWQYANIFKAYNEENAGDITENKCCNSAKKTFYLKAYESITGMSFKMMGLFVVVAIVLALVMDGMGVYSNSSSSTTSSPTKQSDNYNSSSSENNSHSSGYSNSDEIDKMKDELDDLKDEIDSMESDLENISSDLDNYKRQYNNLVEEYNELYEEYSAAIENYNEKANDYNELAGLD